MDVKETYRKITDGMSKFHSDEQQEKARDAWESLISVCQEYLRLNNIMKDSEPARNVLQNYLGEDEQLTHRKKSGVKKNGDSGLDIVQKLYIEFFWNAYKSFFHSLDAKKTETKFFNEIIEGTLGDTWDIIFKNNSKIPPMLKGYCMDAVYEFDNQKEVTSGIDSLHLDKLHWAMKRMDDALNIPYPDKMTSTVELIKPSELEAILSYLESELPIHIYFRIAPIRRALTDGKNNKFFNTQLNYDLFTLEAYLDRLKFMVKDYHEDVADLAEIIK